MIKIDIKKAFYLKNQIVVENFALQCDSGERICIKGRSGIGKTTILKIMAGIHKGYEGEVSLNSTKTAYIPQNAGLLPWKSVMKNVVLFNKGNKNNHHAFALLEKLDLKGLEKRFPMQLSGGQRQRVALAQALFFAPDIFLLDESFSALDGETKNNTLDILDAHLKQFNATLILVSHSHFEGKYLKCKMVEV